MVRVYDQCGVAEIPPCAHQILFFPAYIPQPPWRLIWDRVTVLAQGWEWIGACPIRPGGPYTFADVRVLAGHMLWKGEGGKLLHPRAIA